MVNTSAKPTEEASRERILHVALSLFMERGYADISTRHICAAAGVKQPSLYHHFGNKEGLYLATIQYWFQDVQQRIESAIQLAATIREQLHMVAVIFWTDSIGDYQAMQHDAMQHIPIEHRTILFSSIWESVVRPVYQVMQKGIQTEIFPQYADPFILTQIYWATITGIASVYHRGDPMPDPDKNGGVIDYFIAGTYGISEEAYSTWPKNAQLSAFFPNT